MCRISTANVADIPISLFDSIEHAANFIIDKNSSVVFGNAIAMNPEKVIAAYNDPELKLSLQHATITYSDGIGVVKILEKRTGKKISRIPGCELWEALMKRAGEHKIPVYLLGATEDVLSETVSKLENEMGVTVAGKHNGYFTDEQGIIDSILASKAKIVSVAMGSPKQELFIQRCMNRYPECFYMGVGGTFNVFTGTVKRAPQLFINLNLEWLFRLIKEPTRIVRHVRLLKYIVLILLKRI